MPPHSHNFINLCLQQQKSSVINRSISYWKHKEKSKPLIISNIP